MSQNFTYDYGFVPGSGIMREDLEDVIVNASPRETPLFTALPSVNVASPRHDWGEESDETLADNALAEGGDYTYAEDTPPSRLLNWCQIISRTIKVSKSLNAADLAGIEQLYTHIQAKKLAACAKNAEAALMTGTGNSGSSAAARRMKGVFKFVTTNVKSATATRYLSASKDILNSLLNDIWTNGASEKSWALFCPGFQKIQLATFTGTSLTKNVNAGEYKVIDRVEVYDGPIGMIRVVPERYMPIDKIVCLEMARLKRGTYRTFTHERTPSTGSYISGVIEGEITLILKSQTLHGIMQDLRTS